MPRKNEKIGINMFKEIIISIIIIITVLILNYYTHRYTNESVMIMDNELEDLRNLILSENMNNNEIEKNIKVIRDKWRKRYSILAYFIEHDELEKVETQLTAIEGDIYVENYKESIPELDKCVFILNHIKDKDSFNIQNIF